MQTSELSLKEIIWQLVAAIPKGKIATYGQIAKAAGYPGHARYVGTTLKNLPKDTKLPWHRVINAQGRLSFPIDSQAYLKQKSRLEAEGVTFINGKICLKIYASI